MSGGPREEGFMYLADRRLVQQLAALQDDKAAGVLLEGRNETFYRVGQPLNMNSCVNRGGWLAHAANPQLHRGVPSLWRCRVHPIALADDHGATYLRRLRGCFGEGEEELSARIPTSAPTGILTLRPNLA